MSDNIRIGNDPAALLDNLTWVPKDQIGADQALSSS
jgi:hypothetical protein